MNRQPKHEFFTIAIIHIYVYLPRYIILYMVGGIVIITTVTGPLQCGKTYGGCV